MHIQNLDLLDLIIIYHSRTGGTKQMAFSAFDAAKLHSEAVEIYNVENIDFSVDFEPNFLNAKSFIFACPENLATMSGEMKSFFDKFFYKAIDKIQARPYAVMICAGSDGENTVRQINRIVTAWKLKLVAEPLIIKTNSQTPEQILSPKVIAKSDLQKCSEIAESLVIGVNMGIF